MTYFPDCFQKTLQIAVCTVLAAALLMPMSGQAASERKQSGKSKKPVATKVVERKKSTTLVATGFLLFPDCFRSEAA